MKRRMSIPQGQSVGGVYLDSVDKCWWGGRPSPHSLSGVGFYRRHGMEPPDASRTRSSVEARQAGVPESVVAARAEAGP